MKNPSRKEAMVSAVAAALACASSVSLVNTAFAKGHEEISIPTVDGLEISITSDSKAMIISSGRVIDALPTGTYNLPEGQNIVIENGRVVSGSAAEKRYAWAAFALKPADRRATRPADRRVVAPKTKTIQR